MGRRTQYSRARYSTVKRPVNNHSSAYSTSPWRAEIGWTLSSTTTVTLSRIATMSVMSNRRPARVSASKMMV
jgi:hypothetical protein